jgi:hypothetical protein
LGAQRSGSIPIQQEVGQAHFFFNGADIGHVSNIPEPYDWFPAFCVRCPSDDGVA